MFHTHLMGRNKNLAIQFYKLYLIQIEISTLPKINIVNDLKITVRINVNTKENIATINKFLNM